MAIMMGPEEAAWFDTWLSGIEACDTDDDFTERRKAMDEAVWSAVGWFGVSYVDCVRSWLLEAARRLA
jgi:hypothetical protein